MYENLGMLAFTVLIVGQFAAVLAVHSWRATNRFMDDERSSPAARPSEERLGSGIAAGSRFIVKKRAQSEPIRKHPTAPSPAKGTRYKTQFWASPLGPTGLGSTTACGTKPKCQSVGSMSASGAKRKTYAHIEFFSV